MNVSVPRHTLYSRKQRAVFMTVLFLASTFRMIDNYIITVVLEPIKKEFLLSDTQLGLLSGFAFALFYAVLGIPLARWSDRGNRRTVIVFSLAVWSAMTALCGMAQSYLMLLLARVGVGAGEAGSAPASQSLIADYYPVEKRAGALAIFSASNTIGVLLAYAVGAQLAATYGWRTTLVIVGLPGIFLALLARLFLKEPREKLGFPVPDPVRDGNLRGTARSLWSQKSYVYVVSAVALYTFAANGVGTFFPSFMVRVLGTSVTDMGAQYGIISAASVFIGTLGGGWIANRAAERDIRWLVWLPAMGVLLAYPAYAVAFFSGTFKGFLIGAFVAGTLLGGTLPSAFAALHAVCGTTRRAVAVAVMYFVLSMVGTGLGPVVTGMLSDALTPLLGKDGLTWALVIGNLTMFPCALCLWLAGRTLLEEVEV